ncbi:unnamed protein product [Ceratitis capitata]|uniref:(Mediterranean fruit fly) hypothetical protein n=1 Tax=Ceratitis capitata TaxID=7213 RepID=A0A811UN10_CERCA|nr:unnamed protein product [Ceratitis capitata]
MHLLVLMNYFEKRAEANNRLRDLIAQVAQNLMKKEEKIKLENELLQETLTATMDAYELECIFRQLKIQHQQQSATHEHMLIAYKHSVEFCVKVNNIDWNMQLHSKLELLQLKCQNEMRELSKEYEMEKERRRTLEQRPIVQEARAAEKEIANIQSLIHIAKERSSTLQAKLLEQQQCLQDELNATILFLVTGSEKISEMKRELEAYANNAQVKELAARKQELISKIQKLSAKVGREFSIQFVFNLPNYNSALQLPVFTTGNEFALRTEQAAPKLDNVDNVSELEVFSKMGKTNNANDMGHKEISFLDLFKEWELKKQQQYQELIINTAKPHIDNTITIPALMAMNNFESSAFDITLDVAPKSALRRQGEDNVDLMVPKKRVRFATPETKAGDGNEIEFIPSSTSLLHIEDERAVERKENGFFSDTYVIDSSGIPSFNGDTETIEILSTGDVDNNNNEKSSTEKVCVENYIKPDFMKAKKLLKKARLLGSQKQNQIQRIPSSVTKKPKIEIQECRILKPAGTKLPTKFPIVITPEPETTKDNIFKSPLKPQQRTEQKPQKVDETIFQDFLKESSDDNSQISSDAVVYKAAKETDIDRYNNGEQFQAKECTKSKNNKIIKWILRVSFVKLFTVVILVKPTWIYRRQSTM